MEFTLIFDPKDNGGGDIRGIGNDKTGVKVPEEWSGKLRSGLPAEEPQLGRRAAVLRQPLTEVLAAVLDGVPGGENWQLKIHTREPFATNGEGQVRLMFVFMHVEPEMEDVKDENGNPLAADGKVDKEKKPWENEPEAQQRVKTRRPPCSPATWTSSRTTSSSTSSRRWARRCRKRRPST